MKPWQSRLALALCLLLTLLLVYDFPLLTYLPWVDRPGQIELPFTTLLTAEQGVSHYISAESHLWLLTQPEQIDRVWAFVSAPAVARLEQVDYRRSVVIVLLTATGVALTVEQVTARDGVITVFAKNATLPAAQSILTSTYQLVQIPRNRTTQAPRKLVLHLLPAASARVSPLPGPTAPQPTSPISGTVSQ